MSKSEIKLTKSTNSSNISLGFEKRFVVTTVQKHNQRINKLYEEIYNDYIYDPADEAELTNFY